MTLSWHTTCTVPGCLDAMNSAVKATQEKASKAQEAALNAAVKAAQEKAAKAQESSVNDAVKATQEQASLE